MGFTSDWKQKANAEERLQIARKCAKGYRRRAFGAEHCASGHEQAGMEQCFPAVQGMDERALCNNKDKKMEAIKIIRYLSPVGEMMIGSYGGNLCICDWAKEKRRGTDRKSVV